MTSLAAGSLVDRTGYMSVFDVEIKGLLGGSADLSQYEGKAALVVNGASMCGLTPQYASVRQAGAATGGLNISEAEHLRA